VVGHLGGRRPEERLLLELPLAEDLGARGRGAEALADVSHGARRRR